MNTINSDLSMYSLILLTSYICSLFVYQKTTSIILPVNYKTLIIIYSIVISISCAFLKVFQFPYFGFVFFVLTVVSFYFLKKGKYYIKIPAIVFSIGIQFGAEIISVFFIATILYFLGFREENIFMELCVSLFQFFLVFLITKIRRIQNGFSFFKDKKNFGISLLISGPIITLISCYKNNMTDTIMTFIAIGMIVSALGLFIWIRSAFTRHYRKRLKLRAEEYSKFELAEKEKEIEKLSDENTSLSSIIHLDNHIIQSIESELKALNSTELTDKLLTSINQRNEYVNDLLIKSKNLASTGNAEIDAVLLDLYIKSASRGIDYNLSADCDINYLLNNIISVSDFEALLLNLITNSIVDIENNPDTPGRISIKISQPNDIYELTVMDNGVFNDNNSIPDIVEKSKASIKIKEFDNNASFTKSITIRFDGMKSVI